MGEERRRPRQRPFFGWVVVAAAFTVLFVAYGVQFSFGVLVKAIGDDLGWSRSTLVLPYAIYVFVYSALSSVAGVATDRIGPRRVVLVGGLLLGTGWASFGAARKLWQVYLTLGLVAGVGMSAAWVPTNATVVRWFSRRRGLAVGIASAGGSAGNLVVPVLVALAVDAAGWRPTVVGLGIIVAVALVLASRFFVRDPEQLGLGPDGDPRLDGHGPGPDTAVGGLMPEPSLTLAEARRTSAFWVVFGIFAATWLVVFVPFVHGSPHARDLGASAVGASLVLSAIGLGGITGRLGTGPVSDRFGRRPTLAAMVTLQVVSFILFATAATPGWLYPPALVFGFSYGGAVTCFPALVGDVFGRAHAGTIVGTLFAASGSLGAVGPWLAGWLFDATDSYRAAYLVSAVSNVVALALVGVLRRPETSGAAGEAGGAAVPGEGPGCATPPAPAGSA
jgi:MFS family permease